MLMHTDAAWGLAAGQAVAAGHAGAAQGRGTLLPQLPCPGPRDGAQRDPGFWGLPGRAGHLAHHMKLPQPRGQCKLLGQAAYRHLTAASLLCSSQASSPSNQHVGWGKLAMWAALWRLVSWEAHARYGCRPGRACPLTPASDDTCPAVTCQATGCGGFGEGGLPGCRRGQAWRLPDGVQCSHLAAESGLRSGPGTQPERGKG